MTHEKRNRTPMLRLPEFKDPWADARCDYFLKRVSIPVAVEADKLYSQIGVRSHGKGVFHKEPVSGASLGEKRVFEVIPNTLTLNIVFAWEQALAILTERDLGFVASHRFPMYSASAEAHIDFFKYFFLRPRGKWLLELASPGGAGRNKTLGQSNFAELKVCAPSFAEQHEIADFLSAVDEKIEQLTRKKTLLEEYKKGCIQQIFSQKIRFKDDYGNEFPQWEEKRLDALISDGVIELGRGKVISKIDLAVCPGDYPVFSSSASGEFGRYGEYMFDEELITWSIDGGGYFFHRSAQKFSVTNVCGYLRILSDKLVYGFLLACLKHQHESLVFDYQTKAHPSVIKKIYNVFLPHPAEQKIIADFLSALDRKIILAAQECEQARRLRSGLLQKLFV